MLNSTIKNFFIRSSPFVLWVRHFSALIIRIWLDGMVVHPTQAHKKGTRHSRFECTVFLLSAFVALLLHRSQAFIFSVLPNLPLIFIIGIPGKSSQFYAVHIRNRRKLPASLSFLLRHLYILNSLNSWLNQNPPRQNHSVSPGRVYHTFIFPCFARLVHLHATILLSGIFNSSLSCIL